ncbi:MAG TPA: AAA family ATPase [Kribbellaceae bacterium]
MVTFLVADIDGDGQPAAGAEDGAPARYDLMRTAIASHGAYVFHSLEGAFCAAFAQPSDAALAAYDLRRALTTAERGELGPAAVRVALHSGVAELRDDGYVGVALQRLARLLGAARGGQVLLSAAVVGLLGDPPPPPLTLRSLGVHRLSDLTRAEEIHQLVMPDLPSDFPPLRTLDRRRHNLPVQLSSFVGRERELADVKRALADGRLVTLTGVGGSGKSRLALQAAADLVDDLPDGAWLVELAPLTEPERVPSAVAAALEIPEDPHRPLIETLADELRSKRLLVLVDNCEHLLAASAQLIATLLQAAPGLRVLATSREALTVPGEVILPVSPLPVPPEGTDASALADFPAVRLFAERATAVRPEFTLTAAHAAAVVQIVTHLDGIPLALELAAARVKVCCPSSRSPPVSRTVSACSAAAPGPSCHGSRRCRRRWTGVTTCSRRRSAHCCGLSVFGGGWTVEAAETVCSGDGVDTLDVLDLLGRLVDKSLVLVVEGTDENRYRLLETVRQYGNGHLADADESTTTRTAHRDWCRSTVEAAAVHVRGGEEQARWLERLESDHGSRPS